MVDDAGFVTHPYGSSPFDGIYLKLVDKFSVCPRKCLILRYKRTARFLLQTELEVQLKTWMIIYRSKLLFISSRKAI